MPDQVTDVRVRDVNIKLHRAGRGDPLLFLHGAGGVPMWLPFYDALADGYELLVPEHPGFGGSDDPDRIRTIPDLAMFYLDFIEELGLDRFHLIGHSLGGWVAAEMLVRDRARCRSLTLIAPAGIRIKGMPGGDLFIWNPEETQRNLFYDQKFVDQIFPAAYAELWHKRLPDARVVVLDQCGHIPQVEKEDAVVASVRGFLKEAGR